MVKISIWRINRTIALYTDRTSYYCRKIYGADKKSEQSLIDYKFFALMEFLNMSLFIQTGKKTHIIIRLWFMTWIGMPILNL